MTTLFSKNQQIRHGTVRFVAGFAWLPVKLSSGRWIWFDGYIKQMEYREGVFNLPSEQDECAADGWVVAKKTGI